MNWPNVKSKNIKRLVTANNELGFQLLSQLVKKDGDKNIFISSFSVAMALSMTYNGAEGETKQALAEILGLTGLSLREVNEANAVFMTMQNRLDAKVQLDIANAIWVQEDFQLNLDFIQRIEEYYAGKAANLDTDFSRAADDINAWVAERTQQKITNLVKPDNIADAIVILVNALYFKGIWTKQFEKEKTKERTFLLLDGSRKQHPMMAQSGNYVYYENDTFQAVSLPYGNGRVSMFFFLPGPTVSLNEFQGLLTTGNWQQWMSQFQWMEGEIVLPRFKVEYEQELLESIQAVGSKGLAGPDFHAMGVGELIISSVIHKTFVEINEEGTEAAAATAVVMRGLSSEFNKFSMIIDRPFFCAIRDNETGLLLFMGYIVEPG